MKDKIESVFKIKKKYLTYSNNFYLPRHHTAIRRVLTMRPMTFFHFKAFFINGIIETRIVPENRNVYVQDGPDNDVRVAYKNEELREIEVYDQRALDYLAETVIINVTYPEYPDGSMAEFPYKDQFEISRPFYYIARSAQDGSYIGHVDEALTKVQRGIKQFFRSDTNHNIASIGWDPNDKAWHGWSHRAWTKFKIGYKANSGDLCTTSGWTDEYLEEHPEANVSVPVGFVAETLNDCRRCAIAFAESVS